MNVEVSELVDQIILAALSLGASDLHFNPCADGLCIYARIHGKLIAFNQVTDFPFQIEPTAMARLKVLAKLSLAERRRPQDGQFHLFQGQVACDLRMATMPTIRGERAVVRILPQATPWQSMASLCLPPSLEDEVSRFFAGTGGMLVASGKVGSGKSTTLYALLRERNQCGDSVLTIEDPVERKLESFSQVEVDEKIGLTFAESLRNALRQDPDMLMVGEIRDELTAQIAVRAGLTGHHLLSTVHADTPEQVITRLLEFGVARSYLAQSLKLVIWQRLVPDLCTTCHGEGCGTCHGVGLIGRHAEFKMLCSSQILQLLTMPTQSYGHELPLMGEGRGALPITNYEQRELGMIVAEQTESSIKTT